MSAPKTLFDKIWDAHLVNQDDDGTCLIYIDRHLVHEVTSPQAFEGLRNAGQHKLVQHLWGRAHPLAERVYSSSDCCEYVARRPARSGVPARC